MLPHNVSILHDVYVKSWHTSSDMPEISVLNAESRVDNICIQLHISSTCQVAWHLWDLWWIKWVSPEWMIHLGNLSFKGAYVAASVQQWRHMTYHKVSVERCQGGGGSGQQKHKRLHVLHCANVDPHHPHHHPHPRRIPLQHLPCDHIGSEAEHEGADEGADFPGGSLSSPLLLL